MACQVCEKKKNFIRKIFLAIHVSPSKVCSMETQTALALEASKLPSSKLAAFMFAGNATFTVRSEKTGTRFTFKVRQPKPDSPHFVSVLTGTDNEGDFSFLGSVFNYENYCHGKRSPISPESLSAKAAQWVVSRVIRGEDLKGCEVWHAGKCGRCGRKLTVPESIETGLGPECATRV